MRGDRVMEQDPVENPDGIQRLIKKLCSPWRILDDLADEIASQPFLRHAAGRIVRDRFLIHLYEAVAERGIHYSARAIAIRRF